MISRNLGFRFTFVTYNILSQTLLTAHRYLYPSCEPKDLEWPRRGHRILTELLINQADIICLQEVECEHLQSLYRPRLDRYGYECLYKKKTGHKLDGCAIFFKRKLFHLLDFKGVEFNQTGVANLLNRDNVGIIAVLKPKSHSQLASQQLVVANTHLLFNPKRTAIRLAQIKLFLSELDRMSFKCFRGQDNERCHHPTILCGDLNSIPESELIKFILRKPYEIESSHVEEAHQNVNQTLSQKRISDISELKLDDQPSEDNPDETMDISEETVNPFIFRSVYPTHDSDEQPYVSCMTHNAARLVDYIFYTPELRLESYRALRTEEELSRIGAIPNSMFPSDHLTLKARFNLV